MRNGLMFGVSLFTALALAAFQAASAATVSLSWSLPTTYTNGSAMDPSAIASVQVTRNFSGVPTVIATIPGTSTLYVDQNVPTGFYGYTVAVVTAAGLVSAPSGGVTANVVAPPPPLVPSAPAGLTVTVGP
jgi:hypothetical protein